MAGAKLPTQHRAWPLGGIKRLVGLSALTRRENEARDEQLFRPPPPPSILGCQMKRLFASSIAAAQPGPCEPRTPHTISSPTSSTPRSPSPASVPLLPEDQGFQDVDRLPPPQTLGHAERAARRSGRHRYARRSCHFAREWEDLLIPS